jgi:hypothetical protein
MNDTHIYSSVEYLKRGINAAQSRRLGSNAFLGKLRTDYAGNARHTNDFDVPLTNTRHADFVGAFWFNVLAPSIS